MESEYYIYCGDKGWWGKSATYVSDINKAQIFSRQMAIEFCAKRYNGVLEGTVSHVPVRVEDVEAVLGK